jgi:hypothetical protein
MDAAAAPYGRCKSPKGNYQRKELIVNMRALTGKALAAVVLSASAVGGIGAVAVVSAGTANAMPISTIRGECAEAGGSFWISYVDGRVAGYNCGYRDISGDYWIDMYDRGGNYVGTA